ncbi:hypothetical protein GNP80_20355 [Aliivibrio fischeri]|uniref:hypothetical protein n=1 Tax=Aliivibrio fischeri TaxID=668 RepID=UPI0012DAAA91|nr:hypothetical protein [Aliivibrio fischeri]MUK94766.1 hypothetical protein [Aliivibrio fischeri]
MAKITDVKLDQPVEFIPYVNTGAHSSCLVDESKEIDSLIMSPDKVQFLINELTELDKLDILEETLQGISCRHDGTPLKTAFPDLIEFKVIIQHINHIYTYPVPSSLYALPLKELADKLSQWEKLGANEINIEFEEKQR